MSDVNEFNAETNEFIVRPYTEEESIQFELDRDNIPSVEITPLPENEYLISAMAKLQSLGLTTEEAKAIVGL